MENFFKSKVLKKDKDYISAVNPTWYQKRFRDFMKDQVFVMQMFDHHNQSKKNHDQKETEIAPLASARQIVNRIITNNAVGAGPQDDYHDDESMMQHSINRESAYSEAMSKRKN